MKILAPAMRLNFGPGSGLPFEALGKIAGLVEAAIIERGLEADAPRCVLLNQGTLLLLSAPDGEVVWSHDLGGAT